MHPKQREIIDLINDYKLADAFAKLDKQVLNNAVYSQLKKTYLTGKTDVDFTDRLLVFVQNLDLKENPAMPDHKAHLKKLIRIGRIGDAIEELCDATEQNGQKSLNNNLLNLSGRYYRAEASKRQGIITDASYNTQIARLQDSLGYYIEEYEPSGDFEFKPIKSSEQKAEENSPTPPREPSKEKKTSHKKVFISYSTVDEKIATALKNKLIEADFKVTIDSEDFEIGKSLTESIEQFLRTNDFIISLVSENSLRSDWVAKESIILMYAERMTDKQFLTALLDKTVFDDDFVKQTEDDKTQYVSDLTKRIIERLKKDQDTDHLDEKRKRGRDFISNFPKIVKRIRENLAVDISGDKFESGMQKIIKHVQKTK